MKIHRLIGIGIVGILLSFPTTLNAKTLKVGVAPGMPFSEEKGGHFRGISVDLWRTIAERNNWKYTFVDAGNNFNAAVKKVENSELDVLIGPVSVTHPRMQIVSYSRPYFINRVGLVVKDDGIKFTRILKNLFMSTYMYIFLGAAGIYIVFCHIVWILERRKNPHYADGYLKGIGYAMWSSFCSFSTRSPAQVEPTHGASRFVAALWAVFSWIILINISALITAALTVSLVDVDDIRGNDDLANMRIASVKGSSNLEAANIMGAMTIPTQSTQESIEQVATDQADGALEDYYTAKQLLKKGHYRKLRLSEVNLGYDEYAFVFQKNSPYLRPFNIELTRLQDLNIIDEICERYISEDEAKFCDL